MHWKKKCFYQNTQNHKLNRSKNLLNKSYLKKIFRIFWKNQKNLNQILKIIINPMRKNTKIKALVKNYNQIKIRTIINKHKRYYKKCIKNLFRLIKIRTH